MPWFRVGDEMTTKSEVLRIPRPDRLRAFGLWAMAGAWSAKELSDGHIPQHMLEELAGRPEDAQSLVDVGLWRVVDDGWQFVEWAPVQPLREKVLEDREKSSQRVKDFRSKHREGNAVTNDVTNSVTNDVSNSVTNDVTNAGVAVPPSLPVPTQPNPSLPDHSSSKSGERPAPSKSRTNGTRIPPDFALTDEMRQWAREHAPDINLALVTEKFVNYWLSKAGVNATKTNWELTWRNWCLTDQERVPATEQVKPETRRFITTRTPGQAAPRQQNPDAWMNR